MKTLAFMFLIALGVVSANGCGDTGNRMVDTRDADIPPQTAVEAQKAAEADLPAP